MDLRTKLSLDGSDFGKTLEDAGKQVGDFQKKTEDASKSVDDMGKATSRSASELLKEMKSMENLGRSTGSYRQQLAQMTSQIQDLTINYRNMSEEMKNSEFGREVAAKIEELTIKAGEYKDAIMDAQASVKALASDTAGWDSMKQGIDVVSSSLQAFTSLGLLGEQTTEKLIAVLAKLKAMEVATNAVIKIGNALQKQSALMMGIAKLQSMALARAKTLEAAATGKATIAQKIFNAVAMANPYVLLATAVIAVVGALLAFSNKSKEATTSTVNLTREVTAAEKAMKTYWSTFGNEMGKSLVKFNELKLKWNDLQTDLEKTKFIDDNKKAFEDLGLAINSVSDAERIINDTTGQVVKSFELRAKAAAYAAVAAEALKEAYQTPEYGTYKAGDFVPDDMPNKWLYGTQVPGHDDTYVFNDEGARLANLEAWNKRGHLIDESNSALKAQVELEQQLADLMKEINGEQTTTNNNTNTNTNNKNIYEAGSVADYEARIASLNKRLKEEALTYAEIRDIQGQIAILQAQRDLAANGGMIPTLAPRTITLEPQIKMPEKLDPLPLPVELELKGFEDLVNETGNVISGLSSINSAVNSIGSSIENLGKGWDDSKSAIENITSTIGNMLTVLQSIVSITQTIQSISEAINALELIGMDIQLAKNIAKEQEAGIEAAQTGVKATNATIDTVGAAANVAKSASAIPVVGWVLALGAVAAIIAMIAGAGSSLNFANGGIVPGTSFSGDRIQANLNSGEMVLNTQQQRNLFNLLDGKSTYSNGGKVEFVIKGQELKGVLNNYDKKMSRI